MKGSATSGNHRYSHGGQRKPLFRLVPERPGQRARLLEERHADRLPLVAHLVQPVRPFASLDLQLSLAWALVPASWDL
jgi:hypothetical protein